MNCFYFCIQISCIRIRLFVIREFMNLSFEQRFTNIVFDNDTIIEFSDEIFCFEA